MLNLVGTSAELESTGHESLKRLGTDRLLYSISLFKHFVFWNNTFNSYLTPATICDFALLIPI